jgi:hypothetical protein
MNSKDEEIILRSLQYREAKRGGCNKMKNLQPGFYYIQKKGFI